jgi:NAD(P)-dependent dehydrogenase (short-subunit alcohol dehydrogenase family)
MSDAKVALITGANKGIGFEIARQLGKMGYVVLIGARDPERGRAAAEALKGQQIDAQFIELDVTDPAKIESAARSIAASPGRLDVLVNNAGINGSVPPGTPRLEEIRRCFETNVFGVVAVTEAMLPFLRKSKSPRIVNISSGLGSLARLANPQGGDVALSEMLVAYPTSKTALNGITVSYANQLRKEGFKVNAAEPGYTATDLNDNRGTQPVEQGARAAVHLATLGDDGPTAGFFDENGPLPW